MGSIVVLVFILIPLVELFLLIAVAGWIGWLNALFLLIVLSASGFFLLRHTGFALSKVFQSGNFQMKTITDTYWSFLSGWLLAVPGFGTAAAGLLLMLPPVRSLAIRHFRRFQSSPSSSPGPESRPSSPRVIDGEARDITDSQD